MEEGERSKGWLIWIVVIPVCMAAGALLTRWAVRPMNAPGKPPAQSQPAAQAQAEPRPEVQAPQAAPGAKEEIPGDEPQGEASIAWGEKPGATGTRQAAAANQTAPAADPKQSQKDTGLGFAYGALTKAAGALLNNPKAMSALFNNDYVVKGFMSRDTVKNATANKAALANYLKNPANLSKFMAKEPVQAGLGQRDLVNALAGSKMVSAMMDTPGGKALLQDPMAMAEVVKANPDLAKVLANPNILGALMANPRTAGVVAQLQMPR